MVKSGSRLHAFSLFFPGSCPNNRDRRRQVIQRALSRVDHTADEAMNLRVMVEVLTPAAQHCHNTDLGAVMTDHRL